MEFILILTVLLIIAIFVFVAILLGSWLTHISMVKSGTSTYGWANYSTFIKEFNKYNWDNECWGGNSLWDRDNNCKYHANIVQFNYIGMIMKTPYDHIMMKLYVKKYFKTNKINYYKWE